MNKIYIPYVPALARFPWPRLNSCGQTQITRMLLSGFSNICTLQNSASPPARSAPLSAYYYVKTTIGLHRSGGRHVLWCAQSIRRHVAQTWSNICTCTRQLRTAHVTVTASVIGRGQGKYARVYVYVVTVSGGGLDARVTSVCLSGRMRCITQT